VEASQQHQGHGSTSAGLTPPIGALLSRQPGLVLPEQLPILLGEPVTEAAGLLQFLFQPASPLAGGFLARADQPAQRPQQTT
jgi:hypothetical protein